MPNPFKVILSDFLIEFYDKLESLHFRIGQDPRDNILDQQFLDCFSEF